MITQINTFLRLSIHQKILVFRVLGLSVYTYFLFRFFNTRARFGKEKNIGNKAPLPVKNEQNQRVKDISQAIKIVSKYIPWKNVCRHQAYQAMRLCQAYKIPCQAFVGFKKEMDKKEIQAHVWTIAGGKFVTGFCNPSEYIVQSIYNNQWV